MNQIEAGKCFENEGTEHEDIFEKEKSLNNIILDK